MSPTKHAKVRFQQRGITSEVVDLILRFGKPVRKPGNLMEYRMGWKDRNDAVTLLKRQIQRIDKTLNKAVLIDEDSEEIITAYALHG
jgi:hypothetical protein